MFQLFVLEFNSCFDIVRCAVYVLVSMYNVFILQALQMELDFTCRHFDDTKDLFCLAVGFSLFNEMCFSVDVDYWAILFL